jgi:uncharacterized membrane protein/Flp pilus assembly protein TadD
MKITFAAVMFLIAGFCSAYAAERPINELPMYGGQHNPTVETNKENSKSAAILGWKYYYSGNLDTAIKRFNQAWMLDRENADAFYGFGLIMGQRAIKEETEKNLMESIKFLEKAKALSPQKAKIMVDLAFSHTFLGNYLLSNKKSAQDEFKKARFLFFQAEEIEPTYPLIYSNWSVLEFYDGNYFTAKQLLDNAKRLGAKPDPAYEKDLESKVQAGTAEDRKAKENADNRKAYLARVEERKETVAEENRARVDAAKEKTATEVKPASSSTVENLQTTNITSKVASAAICSGARTIDVTDISADGSVVVGTCGKKEAPDDRQVFLYSQSGGVKNLETMGITSRDNIHISVEGEVIWGTFYIKDEGSHVFRYTQLEGIQDLGTMGKAGLSVKGVSNDGSVIVGDFYNSSTERPMLYHGFRYSQSQGFEDLSPMSEESTHPQGVSAEGSLIVGSIDIGANSKSSIRFISEHAFRYSRSDGMKDIGTEGDGVRATGISNDGSVIVGKGTIRHTIGGIAEISSKNFVFVYTDKGGIQKLGAIDGESVGVVKISADGTRITGSYRDHNRESYVYTAKLVLP